MCYRISQAFTGFVPSFIESSELSETGFSIGFYLVFFYWVFNTEVEGGEVAASCQHSAAHFPCRFAAETRCRRLFISQRRRNSFFFCFVVVVVVVVLFVQGFKLHQVTSCEATLPAGSINAPSSRFSHRYVPKKIRPQQPGRSRGFRRPMASALGFVCFVFFLPPHTVEYWMTNQRLRLRSNAAVMKYRFGRDSSLARGVFFLLAKKKNTAKERPEWRSTHVPLVPSNRFDGFRIKSVQCEGVAFFFIDWR